MNARRQRIDTKLLRVILDYDAEIGLFRWRERPVELFNHTPSRSREWSWRQWNSRMAGEPAFISERGGYLRAEIFGVAYSAHDVAWAYVHGVWADEIDHKNGRRGANWIDNLKETDRTGNTRNAAQRIDNSSGVTGVSYHKRQGKWIARIGVGDGAERHLGSFGAFEDAVAARARAAAELGYSDRHGTNVNTVMLVLEKPYVRN